MGQDLRIEPADPGHLDDLDVLFAHGDPRSCQCAYLRLTNAEYRLSSRANNRLIHQQAVRDASAAGQAAGLVAFDDHGPAGWVSFGPREEYARLMASRILKPIDDAPVWSVVCFVVPPRARNRGVATALLDGVIDYARGHAVPLLEGYPLDHQESRRPAANLWRGTLSMFQRAGFSVVATRRQNAASVPQLIVRHPIRPS